MYWTLSWIDSIETISVSWPAARQSVCIVWRIQISNRLWKNPSVFPWTRTPALGWNKNAERTNYALKTIHTMSWGSKCFPKEHPKSVSNLASMFWIPITYWRGSMIVENTDAESLESSRKDYLPFHFYFNDDQSFDLKTVSDFPTTQYE